MTHSDALTQPSSKRHLVLFVATVATTILAGSGFLRLLLLTLSPSVALDHTNWWYGISYSATILAILGAHELGHYLTCRFYGVNCSLPYFLPAPIPQTGTVGAFIRIREPIRTKRVLFDVAIAGPIAGFVVCVPALVLGLWLSEVTAIPRGVLLESYGEPLLLKGVAWLIWGSVPETHAIVMHPVAFAAWFGLLATALNLFPIGQLDGGHISYAVLGRWSTTVTLVSIGAAVGLAVVSASWIVWATLLIVMLFMFGPRHPQTLDEHVPLSRGRLALAVVALLMLVVCFTPIPLEVTELLPRQAR